MREIFDFLAELNENNNRDWFQANKERYQDIRLLHENLIKEIKSGISVFDPLAATPSVKDCIFRIYRDVRFSKDKSPYKTHLGAYIAFGGSKSEKAGYYFHISPGNSFAGGGIYQPSPEVLKKIRSEIYFDSETFKGILNNKPFKEVYDGLFEDKLTRPPKYFSPDFPDMELLKYKSYFVDKALTDKEMLSDSLVENLLEYYKTLAPLNVFLNRAFE
jgi:uncharacterized protein (TIGR02453 family)